MKVQKLISIVVISLGLLISGCRATDDDDVGVDYRTDKILFAHNAKLKQTLSCGYFESAIEYIESEFEYDETGKLTKVSRPMYENDKITGLVAYDLYFYNAKNQLEQISNYNLNNSGFVNLQNTVFVYDDNGNKIKEQMGYPVANVTDYILYFYDNNRLIREESYHRDVKESYIDYKYNANGEIIEATSYGVDNIPYIITKHTYRDGLNIKSEIFIYADNTKYREIRRIYDKNDNLIFLESEELSPVSSATSYVLKYEYY
jgi:hypothetical protein